MHFDLFHELALPPGRNASESEAVATWLEELALADRLGFRCAWLVEHHFTRHYAHSSAPEVLLGAASQRTGRLRLGLGVIPLPHHHPVRVAERVATLDVVSGGRVEVGIGRGFAPEEYRVFGVSMADSRRLMEEGLRLLRASFARKPVPFGPEGHSLDILPKPVQEEPPLWAAAVSPESFVWAARAGLGLLAGPFKPWFMTRADIERYCEAWEGPRPPRVGLALGVFCLEDGRQARLISRPAFEWFYRELYRVVLPVLERHYPSYGHFRELGRFRHLLRLGVDLGLLERFGMVLVGSPAECVDRLGQLAEAGVTHVLCAVGAGAVDTHLVRESMEVLAAEVMPHFVASPAEGNA
jgi:alkanesulfonate monooxygenase SsuD/methylene tetrahydromethanopterin reductase-like flavin-dependent oxidoreductase (luciferase family)